MNTEYQEGYKSGARMAALEALVEIDTWMDFVPEDMKEQILNQLRANFKAKNLYS